MVTFKNNNLNRRNNFRRSDRNFKTSSDRIKINHSYSNGNNFVRKSSSRNLNASKLVEKYNNLAREALSSGDKILSENYLQHADHFTRVLNEKESFKKNKFLDAKAQGNDNQLDQTININTEISNNNLAENTQEDQEIQKVPNLE